MEMGRASHIVEIECGSPTCPATVQNSHAFMAIVTVFKLECLKMRHKLNHFALHYFASRERSIKNVQNKHEIRGASNNGCISHQMTAAFPDLHCSFQCVFQNEGKQVVKNILTLSPPFKRSLFHSPYPAKTGIYTE
jgi:hypothetical protein